MSSFPRFKNMTSASHEKGFTLIEVLVSIVIFTIAILGTYKLQLQSTISNALSDRISTSTAWADYFQEELTTSDYSDDEWKDTGTTPNGVAGLDDIKANADYERYIRPDGSTTTTAAAGDLYSIYWNIADNSPIVNTKQLRIHVFRNGGIGSGFLYAHDYYKSKED